MYFEDQQRCTHDFGYEGFDSVIPVGYCSMCGLDAEAYKEQRIAEDIIARYLPSMS